MPGVQLSTSNSAGSTGSLAHPQQGAWQAGRTGHSARHTWGGGPSAAPASRLWPALAAAACKCAVVRGMEAREEDGRRSWVDDPSWPVPLMFSFHALPWPTTCTTAVGGRRSQVRRRARQRRRLRGGGAQPRAQPGPLRPRRRRTPCGQEAPRQHREGERVSCSRAGRQGWSGVAGKGRGRGDWPPHGPGSRRPGFTMGGQPGAA